MKETFPIEPFYRFEATYLANGLMSVSLCAMKSTRTCRNAPGSTIQAAATPRRYVSYLRVSTDKQGLRGLGIEAQRETVSAFLKREGDAAILIAEFAEVESGKKNQRPQLSAALQAAKLSGATLIIAKLDRLSRNVHFLTGLQEAGVEFRACDLPEANELTLTIMAAFAQHERKMISQRTKTALAAAKARGTKLGNPNGALPLRAAGRGNTASLASIKGSAADNAERVRPLLQALAAEGITSANAIAKALNARHVQTPRGGVWDAKAVIRLRSRLGANGIAQPSPPQDVAKSSE